MSPAGPPPRASLARRATVLTAIGDCDRVDRRAPPDPYFRAFAERDIARRIRCYLAARRTRDDILDGDWFSDPAWDVLLDLLASQLECRLVSVSSACIAAAVPQTTALRYIDKLVATGSLIRTEDQDDRRRAFIELDPALSARLEQWVTRTLMQ